jgi:hypothetical protein
MGKKKEVGNVVSIDLPKDEEVKKKRVMSEKQKENLSKGMAALKAKREALRNEQETDSSEHVVAAPAPVTAPVAEVKPKRTYTKQPKKEVVGVEEFNNFKNELYGKLQPKEVIKEVSIEKIVDRPIITEKVIEREKFLSGSELINKIFFS